MSNVTTTPGRRTAIALLPVLAVLLMGCEDPETYPVSGAPCAPTDPVQTLDASDCRVP
ncbi:MULTISPECIES: hypothetical protein [unclassified Roseivivax]|uniref:hypothetical protein n=1 Tax=unclassified Roseivivax TaxID=2639302 RepID=UPI001561D590|nr:MULTISPECIES: hypothetical protein [unclassified Roseivivax]